MTTNTGATELSARLTRAVKAELARRGMTGQDLTEPLRLGRNAVYTRLRQERPFNAIELDSIARFLGIDISTLFASADLELVAA